MASVPGSSHEVQAHGPCLLNDGQGLTFEYLPGSLDEAEFLYEEIFTRRSYISDDCAIPRGGSPVVVDVGANIGLFTLFALRENARARVFALEPAPSAYALLEKNLASTSAVCLPWLLREASGKPATLHCYPDAPGESTANPRERQRQKQRLAAQPGAPPAVPSEALACRVPLATHTLTDLFRQYGLERVDLLKVDVEGDECRVLHGISPRCWARIRRAVIEVHDTHGRLARIRCVLHRHGFRTSVVRQEGGVVDGYEMVVPSSLRLFYVYAVRPRDVKIGGNGRPARPRRRL